MILLETLWQWFIEGALFLRNYALFPVDGETFSPLRLLSLLLAFSISGAMVVFLDQGAVLKYFGPQARKQTAFLVASLSGAVLAVCSCSVLPMFTSIRKKGAGLGPAIAFLFSGPAINVLAITLTFTSLGLGIGLLRLFSAIFLALLIAYFMHLAFRRQETSNDARGFLIPPSLTDISLKHRAIFFVTLIAMLVFGVYVPLITGLLLIVLVIEIALWFTKDDLVYWGVATWDLAKKILPLFVVGVFLAGVLQAALPTEVITQSVGQNNYLSNLLASTFGAFMYFATMTEIPIIVSLMNLGMHPGPALALLLAGPTLSLPNMIVIRKELGSKKAFSYFLAVMLFSAVAGLISGLILG